MDSALEKEYQAFRKRSLLTPTVDNSKRKAQEKANGSNVKVGPGSSTSTKKAAKRRALPHQLLQISKKQAQQSEFNYKQPIIGRSKKKFAVLASIVDFMRKRYQGREFDPLTLDEILDHTKNTDISQTDRHWLAEAALKNNEKLSFENGKYVFKPKYPLRDRKSLLKLLDHHEQKGLGGILLDDVREGLPDADDVVKSVSQRILFVTRTNDKKAVLFSYDRQYAMEVDEEIQKHWRSATVEGLGEAGIEKYLEEAGISVMQGITPVSNGPVGKKKKPTNRKRAFKKQNTHLSGDVLKDYST